MSEHGAGPNASSTFLDRTGVSTSSTWTLNSEAGLVRAHVRSVNAACWQPEDKLSGLRMYYDDARNMMKKIGPLLGDPGSTGDGIVVIDTVSSPGVPSSRWIYSTRPVYF